MQRFEKILLTALAMGGALTSVAESFVVSVDTVVKAEDVATYLGAEAIEIREGATLTFKDLAANATLTAKLTGGGHLEFINAVASTVRITLDGDATEFAGDLKISQLPFTITRPAAIGTTPIVYYFKANPATDKSYLRGPATYFCPIDMYCSSTGKFGLFLDEGVVLKGPIHFQTGRLNGPGTAAGLITIDKTIYLGENIRIAGDVAITPKKTCSLLGDGTPYVIAGPLSNVTMLLVTKTMCSFDGANLLDPEQVLTLGGSSNQTGTYELNGFDQIAGRFEWKVAPTTDADKAKNILTSREPATLTLLHQEKSVDFTGVVNEHLSLCVAGTGTFTLSGVNNTTDGSIIASNGFITVAETASFANLSNLVVKGEGVLTVNSATVNPGCVDMLFYDNGKLVVDDGLTLEVGHALLGGQYLDAGTYFGDDAEGPLAGRLTGTLKVANGEPIVEGKTYTWVGGTADDAIDVADNWKEGVAPTFDGRERLVFGTEPGSSARAVVVGEVSVHALAIDAAQPFSLEAANGASLRLGAGGFAITNRLDETSAAANTVSVSCPINLSTLPQNWTVGKAAILENSAPLSSDETSAPLTISSLGRVMFKADNSALLAPIEITDIAPETSDSQPFVYHPHGLGAPSRYTTINGAFPRLVKPSTAKGTPNMTNATPIKVTSASTKTGYLTYTNAGDHYWVDAPIRVFGEALCNLYVYGYCHILGGIVHEGTGQITLRVQQRELYIQDNPIQTSGDLSTDYNNKLYLNASDNRWRLLGLLKSTVVCGAEDAIDPTAPIRVGSNNIAYWSEKMGEIDLNGIDQKCARVYRQWNPWAAPNGTKDWGLCHALLTSKEPAQLEITSESNDSMPIKVEGAAGITFNGTGSLAFTNFVATTVGTLKVARGAVRFDAGSGWTGTTNVVIGAEGRLVIGTGTGATAFGPTAGASAANLSVVSGGKLEIAAGEQPTVRTIDLVEDGARTQKMAGVYGGPSAAGPVDHRVDWIEGEGTLRVLKPSGMLFILK